MMSMRITGHKWMGVFKWGSPIHRHHHTAFSFFLTAVELFV